MLSEQCTSNEHKIQYRNTTLPLSENICYFTPLPSKVVQICSYLSWHILGLSGQGRFDATMYIVCLKQLLSSLSSNETVTCLGASGAVQ